MLGRVAPTLPAGFSGRALSGRPRAQARPSRRLALASLLTPLRPAAQASSRGLVVLAAALPSKYTSLKPVGDRVLVKVTEEATVSAGGIMLPRHAPVLHIGPAVQADAPHSSAQSKPTTGTVVSLGDGKNAKTGNMVPIDVRVGDRVVYSKYAGTEVSVAGVAHLVLKSEDVIGTLDGDDIGALKPYGDRVLIVKAALTPSTSGGVLLPSSASDSVPTGRVRAVGPGKLRDDGGRDAMLLDAGAAVLYAQFSGMEFEADAQAPAGYVVVRSDDIMVRLE